MTTRLAPEHPYPAAVHDSWEALLWTVTKGAQILNLNLSKLAIGGSSAGGNLAAVMTQKALLLRRQRPSFLSRDIEFLKQLLIVPVTDNTANVENNPTYKSSEHVPALPALKMLWYRNHYLPDRKTWVEAEASPLLFPAEGFADLPPAVVIVGQLDVLRHEGEEYARKLRDAGVEAKVEVMPGMPHPFLAMDAVLDEGKRAITILCDTLVEVFA
jgi:acetyl esterase/lipase